MELGIAAANHHVIAAAIHYVYMGIAAAIHHGNGYCHSNSPCSHGDGNCGSNSHFKNKSVVALRINLKLHKLSNLQYMFLLKLVQIGKCNKIQNYQLLVTDVSFTLCP